MLSTTVYACWTKAVPFQCWHLKVESKWPDNFSLRWAPPCKAWEGVTLMSPEKPPISHKGKRTGPTIPTCTRDPLRVSRVFLIFSAWRLCFRGLWVCLPYVCSAIWLTQCGAISPGSITLHLLLRSCSSHHQSCPPRFHSIRTLTETARIVMSRLWLFGSGADWICLCAVWLKP